MEEKSRPVDRRVIRTKRAIRTAFARLLNEKEVNDITIQDIANYADINRKTFYNYYSGIHQVIDEVENEVVQAFEKAIAGIDFRRALRKPYIVFEKLTELINSDLDFYGYLMSMRANSNLAAKLIDLLKEKVRVVILEQLRVDEDLLDITLNYTVSGMVAVYQEWFNSDSRQSIEEVSEILSIICFNGYNGMMRAKRDKNKVQ